ncbi:MAG: hypothetical protein N2450_04625 [bacterium]|nr:hypothetical protein [bacterium]
MPAFKILLSLLFLTIVTGCIERYYLIKWDSFQKPTVHFHWTGDSVDLETGPLRNINDNWLLMNNDTIETEQPLSFSQFGYLKKTIQYNEGLSLIHDSSPINPTVRFQRYFLPLCRIHLFTATIPCASNIQLENPFKDAPVKPNFDNDSIGLFLSPQTKLEIQEKYQQEVAAFYLNQFEKVLQSIRDSLILQNVFVELPEQWTKEQSLRWFNQLNNDKSDDELFYYWSFLKDSILPSTLPPDKLVKALYFTNAIEDVHRLYQDISDETITVQLIKKGILLETNADSVSSDTLFWMVNNDQFSKKEPIHFKATMILFDPLSTIVLIFILIGIILYRILKRNKIWIQKS